MKSQSLGVQALPLPSSEPGQPYSAVVADADIFPTSVGGPGPVGLMWVLTVTTPERYAGKNLAHMTRFDAAYPESFEEAAGELAAAGLSVEEIAHGNLPELLKGRQVCFDYVAPNKRRKQAETIRIVAGPASADEHSHIEVMVELP